MVRITRPRATKLSELTIDCDLAMLTHDITLGAGQTVDGKDVSDLMDKTTYDPNNNAAIAIAQLEGGKETGAIVDYKDCADKQLDADNSEEITASNVYVNIGTPYTIQKADMDDKSAGVKVTLATEIKTSHGAWTATVGYNINGGGDVDIGNTNFVAWTPKNITDIVIGEGDVIQFRLKNAGANAHCQLRIVTQTHAARKAITGYY